MARALYYDPETGKVSTYDPSANTPKAITDGALINPDLSAVIDVPMSRWEVVDGVVVDGGEDLNEVKSTLFAAIDDVTNINIVDGRGFEWPPGSGNFFSTTMEAQTKWTGLYVTKDVQDFVNDPPTVNTKDDLITYEIKTAEEIANMYFTGMLQVKRLLHNGRVVKESVRSADTVVAARAAAAAYLA